MAKISFSEKARAVKRLGVIDYDLRRTLTPAQKGVITKKFNEYGLGNDITVRVIGKAKSKLLKDSGFKVFKSKSGVYKTVLPFSGDVHIKRNSIVQKTDSGKTTFITHLGDREHFFERAKRQLANLKKGESLTLRIGDNNMFRQKRFHDFNSFYHYVSQWTPDSVEAQPRREELMQLMQTVVINQPKANRGSKWQKRKGKR
jgi:hypothetical protein